MANKRLIDKIIEKRDAALADYTIWQSIVHKIENDPDLAGMLHQGKVQRMDKAKAAYQMVMQATAANPAATNGHAASNGHSTRGRNIAKAWTPERRKKQAVLMKKNVHGKGKAHKGSKKGGGEAWRKWTPERTAKFKASMKRRAAAKAKAAAVSQ